MKNFKPLLFLLLLLAAACNDSGNTSDQQTQVNKGTGLTVTPGAFEITILSPSSDGLNVATNAAISGDCGKPGFPIDVTGAVSSKTVCQKDYKWSTALKLSDLGNGSIDVNVQLRERNYTGGSSVVTRSFNKVAAVCTPENKVRLFANHGTGGDGAATPYQICTPQQLVNVGAFADKSFVLADNINFTNQNFIPIATAFSGILDGQGFTIENVNVDQSAGSSIGIFKYMNGATLRNINFKNIYVSGSSRAGLIAGDWRGAGTIENVKISGTVNAIEFTGGVAGLCNASCDLTISNLQTDINVTGNNFTGGLIGYINTNDGGVTITNSELRNNVTGLDYVGGVIGRTLEDDVTLTDVTHRGVVSSQGIYVGGLFGESAGAVLTDVAHIGSVATTKDAVDAFVGGFFGDAKGVTNVTNSYVVSDISSGSNYTGGIAGRYLQGTISGSYTRGSITVNDDYYSSVTKFVGGLVGNIGLGVNVTGSHNHMNINATSQYVGGIAGYAGGASTSISNSYNVGNISARTSFVGGLIGQFAGSSISDSFNKGNIDITNPTPNAYIGGNVGYSYSNSITYSKMYNSGNIIINNDIADNVGGLFGYVLAGSISDVYNTGDISGARNIIGGIAGYLRQTPLTNAYSGGSQTGSLNFVAGIAGIALFSNVSNVFSDATLEAPGRVGGLIGWF